MLWETTIPYRWEFPQGISFSYKEKNHRCRDKSDAEKFWRRYRKDLGDHRSEGEPGLDEKEKEDKQEL